MIFDTVNNTAEIHFLKNKHLKHFNFPRRNGQKVLILTRCDLYHRVLSLWGEKDLGGIQSLKSCGGAEGNTGYLLGVCEKFKTHELF